MTGLDLAVLTGLIETVNEYRTWITAELSPRLVPYYKNEGGRMRVVYGHAIVLTSYRQMYGVESGQQWLVHEYLLSCSLNRMMAADSAYVKAFHDGHFTVEQTECLVGEAMMHLVCLHLDPCGY